jgi:PKHD-type hydroxylase
MESFSNEELEKIQVLMASQQLEDGKVGNRDNDPTKQDGRKLEDVRRSKLGWQFPNEDNNFIFQRLNNIIEAVNEDFYNFDLNGYEAFQYTEYHAEDKGTYDWHIDLETGHQQLDPHQRKLSLTLLLNEPGVDFEGGEFMMGRTSDPKNDIVPCAKGQCILFPSFVMHRVAPVTKGVRKSIVIWVRGPRFV